MKISLIQLSRNQFYYYLEVSPSENLKCILFYKVFKQHTIHNFVKSFKVWFNLNTDWHD